MVSILPVFKLLSGMAHSNRDHGGACYTKGQRIITETQWQEHIRLAHLQGGGLELLDIGMTGRALEAYHPRRTRRRAGIPVTGENSTHGDGGVRAALLDKELKVIESVEGKEQAAARVRQK